MSSTEHVYSDTLGNTSDAVYSRVPFTVTASEFYVDDLAANSSSGEDWDDHDFDRTRDQHQGWDADSEPSDEDPVPEHEPNQGDNPENEVWRTIPQDESLVDSDEEEEIRARWAETDRSPLLASSDTGSSSSSFYSADDDHSSTGYPMPPSSQIQTPRHSGSRTEERIYMRGSLLDFFNPRLLMQRVTSLSETAYMNARARLEDILDDRGLERVWPEYVGNNVFRWYQPVPFEINTADGSFQERGTD